MLIFFSPKNYYAVQKDTQIFAMPIEKYILYLYVEYILGHIVCRRYIILKIIPSEEKLLQSNLK